MTEKPQGPFRFLSMEEFAALSAKDKTIYLSIAAQELENRQRVFREQMQNLAKQQAPKE